MDRLSNTRCSHARSTNISNDHCHAQCLQASSTTTSSVDAQKHRSIPKKLPLLHHLEHCQGSQSVFSHTLAPFHQLSDFNDCILVDKIHVNFPQARSVRETLCRSVHWLYTSIFIITSRFLENNSSSSNRSLTSSATLLAETELTDLRLQ